MRTDRIDELVAKAIAGLPYRRPSAGFSARVMAEIAALAPVETGFGLVMKAACLITAAWAGVLVLFSAGFFYRTIADNLVLLKQPGGFQQFVKLLAAHCALVSVKLYAAVSLGSDLAAAVFAMMPPFYEIAAAALVCAVIIRSVSGGRMAAHRI